jgi:hypothetical protein
MANPVREHSGHELIHPRGGIVLTKFAEHHFDTLAEQRLLFGNDFDDVFDDRDGNSFAEEVALPFRNEFLIAQRTKGEPGKHEARQKDREHE